MHFVYHYTIHSVVCLTVMTLKYAKSVDAGDRDPIIVMTEDRHREEEMHRSRRNLW